MEPDVPALVEMDFPSIVHIIKPPERIPFWPFPQLYNYQLMRFALDQWYTTTKLYASNAKASSSACFTNWAEMSHDDVAKKSNYEIRLEEKYNNYSKMLDNLYNSMLIQ